ncbi:helix-turn-helix domain-containing protein [Actinosynnema sp. NPDC023658]|uniref:TetR/AcrR family transcriptional regulator n=1 Tax=Actinosynnema sp. NPDC023658 TaxID=3155465 RepID=UPI0033E1C311
MPRLWNDTIDAHRRAVRDATLDATAALVAEHGVTSLTMSQIAEKAGIGRATLYKYFPDVEAILVAWHDRQVTHHLHHLREVGERAHSTADKLRAVLHAYARLSRGREGHGTGIAAALHRGEHVVEAHRHLHDFIRDLLTRGAATGELRDDVPAGELADYCLHALEAADDLPSDDAVHRLVGVTLDGLRARP